MKYKIFLTSLLALILLSGCGLKETINQADKVVKKENAENAVKQKETEAKALEEEKYEPEEFPVKVETYIDMQKKAYGATVSTEKDGEHVSHEVKLAKGKIIEHIGSEGDSEYVNGYSIEVTDPKAKTNGKITNSELGLNLVSDFLQEAKLIDKPLNLLFDIDVTKRGEFPLDETNSLGLSPQDDGYIIGIW